MHHKKLILSLHNLKTVLLSANVHAAGSYNNKNIFISY